MGNFTFEETNLLCIYNTGSRTGLIEALTEMRGELSPGEAELRELTDSARVCCNKVSRISGGHFIYSSFISFCPASSGERSEKISESSERWTTFANAFKIT